MSREPFQRLQKILRDDGIIEVKPRHSSIIQELSLKIIRKSGKELHVHFNLPKILVREIKHCLPKKKWRHFFQSIQCLYDEPSPVEANSLVMKNLFGSSSPVFLAYYHAFIGQTHEKNHDPIDDQELIRQYLFLLSSALLLVNMARITNVSELESSDLLLEKLSFFRKFIDLSRLFTLLQDRKVRIIFDLLLSIAAKIRLEKEDLFWRLHQDLFSIEDRTQEGAFFTPPTLAALMVENVFSPDDVVLDPACGTGIFLIELLKNFHQKHALSDDDWQEKVIAFIETRLFGLDIDQTAVHLAKVNLLLFLRDVPTVLSQLTHLNVHHADALFPPPELHRKLNRKFTLCIGNPPWLVLNVVSDDERKKQLKEMARKSDLLPSPHLVTQLELGVLFLQKMKRYYLVSEGKVAFILNKSVLESDNHSKTRRFDELVDVHAWIFDELVFRLPHVCLFARYQPGYHRTRDRLEKMSIPVTTVKVIKNADSTELQFILGETQNYHPISVIARVQKHAKDSKKSRSVFTHQSFLVGKLMPLNKILRLLPRGTNAYKVSCRNGASLFPRNLVSIEIVKQEEVNGVSLTTFRHLIERPRKPWDFDPLEKLGLDHVIVETKFIHEVVRSREIVPFALLRPVHVFLPIEPDSSTGGYRLTSLVDSLGWQYFLKLSDLYRQHVKNGASIKDLWEYLNYQGKLTTPLQRMPIRVVYAASGNKIKGFLLEDSSKIVDFKCYHLPVRSAEEGYYLLGILHAPMISADVVARSGERVYHKRPLDYPIPSYNSEDGLHVELMRHARKMSVKVHDLVHQILSFNDVNEKLHPLAIQRQVREQLRDDFNKLDELVVELFKQAVRSDENASISRRFK